MGAYFAAMDGRNHGEGAAALAPSRAVAVIRRLAGPLWLRIGIAGTLEVDARRSGRTMRVRLIPVNLDGATYLLSFGGITDWALNLRSAGRGALLYKGRNQAFTAIEVDGAERDRVIAKYLGRSGPIAKDFNRRPSPADHPTFKVVPRT